MLPTSGKISTKMIADELGAPGFSTIESLGVTYSNVKKVAVLPLGLFDFYGRSQNHVVNLITEIVAQTTSYTTFKVVASEPITRSPYLKVQVWFNDSFNSVILTIPNGATQSSDYTAPTEDAVPQITGTIPAQSNGQLYSF